MWREIVVLKLEKCGSLEAGVVCDQHEKVCGIHSVRRYAVCFVIQSLIGRNRIDHH